MITALQAMDCYHYVTILSWDAYKETIGHGENSLNPQICFTGLGIETEIW